MKTLRFIPRFLQIGLFVLMGVEHVRSQGTIYTDRSVFNAALQSSTTVDFESLTPSDVSSTGVSPITVSLVPLPIPILTITNYESRLFVTSPGQIYPASGDGQYIWNFDSSYPMGIFPGGGRNAFGADFSGGFLFAQDFNATLTFNLAGGQSYSYNFLGQPGNWKFFGVVFPAAINSVIYDDGGLFIPGGHEEMIDNVTFGVAVPEPQVLSFLVGSLVFWLSSRRRH